MKRKLTLAQERNEEDQKKIKVEHVDATLLAEAIIDSSEIKHEERCGYQMGYDDARFGFSNRNDKLLDRSNFYITGYKKGWEAKQKLDQGVTQEVKKQRYEEKRGYGLGFRDAEIGHAKRTFDAPHFQIGYDRGWNNKAKSLLGFFSHANPSSKEKNNPLTSADESLKLK